MKKIITIFSTLVLLATLSFSATAQKVSGVGITPGYSSNAGTTPGFNGANRRYEPPRAGYPVPAPRNETYHDRRQDDDRYRRNDDCDDRSSRGGYGSRRDEDDDYRRGKGHRDKDKDCCCSHCRDHARYDNRRYDDRRRNPYDYRDRDRGYVDYRDRDRYERSRNSCPPRGKR